MYTYINVYSYYHILSKYTLYTLNSKALRQISNESRKTLEVKRFRLQQSSLTELNDMLTAWHFLPALLHCWGHQSSTEALFLFQRVCECVTDTKAIGMCSKNAAVIGQLGGTIELDLLVKEYPQMDGEQHWGVCNTLSLWTGNPVKTRYLTQLSHTQSTNICKMNKKI